MEQEWPKNQSRSFLQLIVIYSDCGTKPIMQSVIMFNVTMLNDVAPNEPTLKRSTWKFLYLGRLQPYLQILDQAGKAGKGQTL